MANKITQLKYNQVIDNIAYLIIHYPEALKKLLFDYGITFKGTPASNDLSEVVIDKLESGDRNFQNALEQLILRLSANEEDQFLGGLIKGAVGIVGGLINRKRNKRRARRAAAAAAREDQAYARSQAAAAKRDLEIRMQRIREEKRRREEAARKEKAKEERRRKEAAAARQVASKKQTQMMLMIGGGIAVLGLGAVVFMRNSRPAMPYPPMRPPNMPMM
ncbi:hypothetical protein [Aquimarina agarivorans]|uniref:hypothetical protein n=1 Tax=Aquimarina agarivorans TaxID=980584 RepID=UPI000248FC4E|nr:hypothetical protein [Aquimarina agarivorans]